MRGHCRGYKGRDLDESPDVGCEAQVPLPGRPVAGADDSELIRDNNAGEATGLDVDHETVEGLGELLRIEAVNVEGLWEGMERGQGVRGRWVGPVRSVEGELPWGLPDRGWLLEGHPNLLDSEVANF